MIHTMKRKSAAERRDTYIFIRTTKSEKYTIKKFAEKAGKSISAFALSKMFS
jgi:uncharacterized protein (DUF1778 family)